LTFDETEQKTKQFIGALTAASRPMPDEQNASIEGRSYQMTRRLTQAAYCQD